MDEMMEALSSIASLIGLKDGTEPMVAIASSVGLSWKEITEKVSDVKFSFDEVKKIIERFGESLRIGSEVNDDQSETEVAVEGAKPVIGVDFLRNALLQALGVGNEGGK